MNEKYYKELHEDHVEEAKKILEYNRKRLYRLAKKYNSLNNTLTPVLKQDLLDIIAYWLKHDCISYGSHDMVYFLSTYQGTYAVRQKTTRGVTNRRLNYLCALGLMKKLEQTILYGFDQKERRFMRKQSITIVNRNLLKYEKNIHLEPINTFDVFKYTTEILEQCNERANLLLEANITPGNISYNQLAINGLEDIAKEIYLEDRELSVKLKQEEYIILLECIDFLISKKGYTTMQEVYDVCPLHNTEIDKLFKIFKQQLWQTRNYKRPNKQEKEKFGINNDTWIITLKE